MNNWEEVKTLTDVAADSTGSASKKMETYLESIEAKTNELKATWEDLVLSLNQSESYKNFLDICIWILNNLPTVIGYISSLVVLFKGATILKAIKEITTNFGGLRKVFSNLKTDISLLSSVWGINTKVIYANVTAEEVEAATLNVLSGAIGLVIAGVTTAIQIYNSWKQAQVDAGNTAREEADAYEDKAEAMEDAIEQYKEIYNSTDDYSTKQSELETLSENLVTAYGNEAEALDLLNGKYEDNVNAMEAAANAKRKQELASLKVSAEKGESNLDNWINFGNFGNTSVKGNISSKDKNNVMDFLYSIAGNDISYTTSKAAYNSYITKDKVGKYDITGIDFDYSITNEQAQKYAQSINEYLAENIDTLTEETYNTLTALSAQLINEADADSISQYENKQKYQLAKVTQNSDGSYKQEIQDYKTQLKKQQDLEKKYDAETDETKKQQLKQELADEYELTKQALERVKGLYNSGDSDQSTLSVNTILNYLGFGDDGTSKETSNIYAGLDENQTTIYNEIRKELEDTGKLGETARQKLADLKKDLLEKDDGETWVEALNDDLKGVANVSKVNLDEDNLQNEYNNATNKDTIEQKEEELRNLFQKLQGVDDYYQEAGGSLSKANDLIVADQEKYKNLLNELNTLKNENYSNIGNWLSGVNASLSDIGFNVDAKWYQDLSEQLKNGEIDFEQFYTTVSENCKKLGIDLEDLKNATSDVSEEMKVLGSQSDFITAIDEVDDLYDKAAKLKSGKTIDNDDMVELRNKYEEVNEYIAETGDLTLKNGQLLMDLGDEAYNSGQEALQNQIESLEEYQDAILNTVDAMGIMAEFKEELAKIDSDLADTITDNTVEEAKAAGQYVDFTQEQADGAYEASESVKMSNQNLLNSEQTTLQGILDSKEAEADMTETAAEAILEANNAELDMSNMTAEEKIQAANDIIDAENIKTDVIVGASDTQIVAEDATGTATVTNTGTIKTQQGIAAAAAITAAQAFIQLRMAAADADSEEYQTLSNTNQKLEDLFASLEDTEEEDSSDAEKAAAAYAEAQKKIQEAKARLGQYSGVNSSGHSNYNSAGSSSSNSYTADDAADDLKEILNDIEKYEADIEADLEDQTEEYINQQMLASNRLDTLKEELDYYDSIYDATEDTTKWLETQNKILTNQAKKVGALQQANANYEAQRQKLIDENSQYDVASWFDSEGNETLAYGDLLNSYAYQIKEIEEAAAAEMRAIYNGVSNSTDKDTISDAKEKIKNIEDEADVKIKALEKEQEKIENIYDSVSQLNDAWKENQEAIYEALETLNEKIKTIRDELLDDITEQLEKAVDKMNDSIDKDVTRLEQLKQVQESYNDILNDLLDTQQELEDELKTNMDSYQYLDEDMRQLMFNEDDYKQLSSVIEGIQSDIADIWEDHYNQINSLTEDEMYKAEYITNETERQLAAKEKEYELAKAELDVAKAQTNLQNVQNERTTRIYANGQWQWVANPDDVKSAEEALLEAQREKTKLEREQEQQLLVDELDALIDADNLQIDENNELLERIEDAIEEQTTEVKSIQEALANAANEDLPALTEILQNAFGDGGDFKELLININESQLELAAVLKGTTYEQGEALLKSGTLSQSEFEELYTKLGYGWDESTGTLTRKDLTTFSGKYSGWSASNSTSTPLSTAENGVSVTGSGSSSSSSSSGSSDSSSDNSSGSTFPRTGTVTTNSLPLRIRSGAGTQYSVLGSMPKGASVTITGEANSDWAQVKYGNISGYASRKYLTYDQGGLAGGLGFLPKATIEPERVLSPRQTKAFENLVSNITTNPVLNALSKVPSISSNLSDLSGETNNSKNYYFSNFTVQADDIEQFINSIETIMPMKNK
jgi:hypothetical protein